MISSGTTYEIWVAHFVNPLIPEKTSREGFNGFFMCGYIYVCICINMYITPKAYVMTKFF